MLLVSQFSSVKLCAILNSVKHLKTRAMPKTPCIIWTEHASMAGNLKLNSPGETGKVSLKNCSCCVLSFQCCKFYAPLVIFSSKTSPCIIKKLPNTQNNVIKTELAFSSMLKAIFFSRPIIHLFSLGVRVGLA